MGFLKNLFCKKEVVEEKSKLLTEQDYIKAAELLGVDIASIKAVSEVESSGSGFDKEGNIKLLFEGHIFYKYCRLAGMNVFQLSIKYPTICYQLWKDRGNAYSLDQAGQLALATTINEEVAFKSASYGKFQIMGFNCKACGFETSKEFYLNQIESEGNQLIAFCNFIKSNKSMWNALKKKDWDTFAKLYNGASYAQNKYDIKLKEAYNKLG